MLSQHIVHFIGNAFCFYQKYQCLRCKGRWFPRCVVFGFLCRKIGGLLNFRGEKVLKYKISRKLTMFGNGLSHIFIAIYELTL